MPNAASSDERSPSDPSINPDGPASQLRFHLNGKPLVPYGRYRMRVPPLLGLARAQRLNIGVHNSGNRPYRPQVTQVAIQLPEELSCSSRLRRVVLPSGHALHLCGGIGPLQAGGWRVLSVAHCPRDPRGYRGRWLDCALRVSDDSGKFELPFKVCVEGGAARDETPGAISSSSSPRAPEAGLADLLQRLPPGPDRDYLAALDPSAVRRCVLGIRAMLRHGTEPDTLVRNCRSFYGAAVGDALYEAATAT